MLKICLFCTLKSATLSTQYFENVSLFAAPAQGGSVSIQQLPSWAPRALKYPTKSYPTSPIKHFLNTPQRKPI